MVELLIIADDYTGALDSGVQFAEAGAKVKVITDVEYDLIEERDDTNVLVIDAETRHIEPHMAAHVVGEIVGRAIKAGIQHIFKKTDSALRGNVGSELTALLENSGQETLPFIPAFPEMQRTTTNGVHYIEGDRLSESVFSQDPFEPTRESSIPKIIEMQSDIPTKVVSVGDKIPECHTKTILIFDTETVEDLENIVGELNDKTGLSIMAGCAGFAARLPKILNLNIGNKPKYDMAKNMFVANGSVNPVTVSQLDYAEKNGFTRIYLSQVQMLEKGYWNSKKGIKDMQELQSEFSKSKFCIVDTSDPQGLRETAKYAADHCISNEQLRNYIPSSLAKVISTKLDQGQGTALMIMGGDTLMGFLKELNVTDVYPVQELMPGTVLSRFKYRSKNYQVISKSGGFGKMTLLLDLAKIIITSDK